jgi:hypothetical protein
MKIDFLFKGFTTRHWIGTAGVVTVMVLAAAGCWAAIQVSTWSNLVPDPLFFGSWIRIRLRIRICIEAKIQNFLRLKIEPGRGRSQRRPGGSKWSPGGSISLIPIALMRSRILIHKGKIWIRIRVRFKVERWIRIGIKVMRICNAAST